MSKIFLPLVPTTWTSHVQSLWPCEDYTPHLKSSHLPIPRRWASHLWRGRELLRQPLLQPFTPWVRPQWAPLLPDHLTPAFTLWSSPFASCSAVHQPLVFPSDHCHVKLDHSGFSPRKSLSGLCILATAFSSSLHSQTSLLISWLCSLSFSDNSNLASCFHSLNSLLLSL